MSKNEKIDADRYFDKRVVRHYLDRKIVSREAHQGHLDELEDCAERGTPTETRMTFSGGNEAGSKE